MEINTNPNNSNRFLGIVFLAQAILPLIGGLVFQSLEVKGDIAATMANIAGAVTIVWFTILLWIAAAIGVILLGVVLYRMIGSARPTAALFACAMYFLEAIVILTGQICVFTFAKTSVAYAAGGGAGLLDVGSALLAGRHFAGEIAMIPFGIGALIFYTLLMKDGTLPKWLAIWGLVTAPLIMIGVPLTTFGVAVPTYFLIPYMPFEFFTGAYLLIRYRNRPAARKLPAAI